MAEPCSHKATFRVVVVLDYRSCCCYIQEVVRPGLVLVPSLAYLAAVACLAHYHSIPVEADLAYLPVVLLGHSLLLAHLVVALLFLGKGRPYPEADRVEAHSSCSCLGAWVEQDCHTGPLAADDLMDLAMAELYYPPRC